MTFLSCGALLAALPALAATTTLGPKDAPKVHVLSVPAFQSDPMDLAVRMLVDPALKDRRSAELDAMDARAKMEAASGLAAAEQFRGVFARALERGYGVEHHIPATPEDFLRAVQDPRAVAIFHEGHMGVADTEPGAPLYVRFMAAGEGGGGAAPLDAPALRKLEAAHGPIAASPSLRLLYSLGCMASHCEAFYREKLRLPPGARWMSDGGPQNAFNVLYRLQWGERRAIFEILDLEGPPDRAIMGR
ncbi:MAG TPA: hypothetical protein VNI01_00995 [Elusimicrobiota bacterium]|jgi:hypothetical protein|nr:hypothetical protein [Elusimicrobiota bacterium]